MYLEYLLHSTISAYRSYTVELVLRGHHWYKEKVAFKDRWGLLKKDLIHMKFSMTGQEKCDFLIQVAA